jgi:hypothetical protein
VYRDFVGRGRRIRRIVRTKAEASRRALKRVKEALDPNTSGEFKRSDRFDAACTAWLVFEGLVERHRRSPSTLDECRNMLNWIVRQGVGQSGASARMIAVKLEHSRVSMTQDVYLGRRASNAGNLAALGAWHIPRTHKASSVPGTAWYHAQSVGPVGIEPTTRGVMDEVSEGVWGRLFTLCGTAAESG